MELPSLVSERERIADWLDQRGKLLDGPSDEERAVSLELYVTANLIRKGLMGPNGMSADEPILRALAEKNGANP